MRVGSTYFPALPPKWGVKYCIRKAIKQDSESVVFLSVVKAWANVIFYIGFIVLRRIVSLYVAQLNSIRNLILGHVIKKLLS